MHQHPQRPSLAPHQLDCVSFIVTIVRHAKRRPPHYQQQSYPSVAAAGAYAPHQLLAPGPWGPPAAGSYQVPGPPAAPELGLSLAGEGGVSGCKVGRHRTSLLRQGNHSRLLQQVSAIAFGIRIAGAEEFMGDCRRAQSHACAKRIRCQV